MVVLAVSLPVTFFSLDSAILVEYIVIYIIYSRVFSHLVSQLYLDSFSIVSVKIWVCSSPIPC